MTFWDHALKCALTCSRPSKKCTQILERLFCVKEVSITVVVALQAEEEIYVVENNKSINK